MADLQDFHEREARRQEIDKAIKDIKDLGVEKHGDQDDKMLKIFNDLLPFITKLTGIKAQGEKLSLEDNKMFVQLQAALKQIADYLILSQSARSQRLRDATETQYFHLKNLAKQGDKKAEEMYLELKVLRDAALKEELGDIDN